MALNCTEHRVQRKLISRVTHVAFKEFAFEYTSYMSELEAPGLMSADYMSKMRPPRANKPARDGIGRLSRGNRQNRCIRASKRRKIIVVSVDGATDGNPRAFYCYLGARIYRGEAIPIRIDERVRPRSPRRISLAKFVRLVISFFET